uniref:fumarate hydratase n=1 Tax=Biomphalaria glabrata TaxID=6526 RepID=A0A2C9LCQ4_BIOGL
RIKSSMQFLYHLAQGGTAVGTGINAPDGFKDIFIEEISRITGFKFISAQNKFESIAASDAIVEFSGALNTVASSMMKIANDIRMLSSGPRCGIGEIKIPANEPGSSIMPGKVNPTQCEALTMVCVQVIGMHHSITIGGFSGHMELNVFRPMMIFNTLNAINLLSGAINSFNKRCVSGIVANVDRIKYFLNKSLMLVTALVPYIGYDKAAKAAKKADEENILLKDAVIDLGFMDGDKFDEIVDPNKMI